MSIYCNGETIGEKKWLNVAIVIIGVGIGLMMVKNFNAAYIGGLHKPKSILTSTPTILVGNMMIGIVNILKKENGDKLCF